MKTLFSYTPIGLLRTLYKTLESVPKSPGKSPVAEGVIELDPVYEEGLLDIEGFSHLLVIVAFHLSKNKPLLVTPPGQLKERGVFATRSPHRPNAIGVLTVELLSREGVKLHIREVSPIIIVSLTLI